MSVILEQIDNLEDKLEKLLIKINRLESENHDLRTEVAGAAEKISRQTEEIEFLKKQQETLKIANTLLGSDTNKRDTKLKINSLIRDIDYCIEQLSE